MPVQIAWHAIGFFPTNYWVTFCCIALACHSGLTEVTEIIEKGPKSYLKGTFDLKYILTRIIWTGSFYFTPWVLSDLLFYAYFIWTAGTTLLAPVIGPTTFSPILTDLVVPPV